MAKQVKTIKCPQCGSIQKTELKPDHFRCDSCGARYFLTNDDVNINIRHIFGNIVKANPLLRYIGIFIVVTTLFPLIITGIVELLSHAASTVNVDKVSSFFESHFSLEESNLVEINGKAYIACIGERENLEKGDEREGEIICFLYDVEEDKIINETLLDVTGKSLSGHMRRFADGSFYLSVNNRYLYRLNKSTMRFEDYLPILGQKYEMFSSGAAEVNVIYPEYGDGFNIMSNTGTTYTYFPLADTLCNWTAARTELAHGMKSLLPGARDSTHYYFDREFEPSDTRLPWTLVEVTFKYNAGGPMDIEKTNAYYNWKYVKEDPTGSNTGRIVNVRDIMPRHIWFDPDIVYMGRDELLVSTKVAIVDKSLCIQKVDVRTGRIEWTTPVGSLDRHATRYRAQTIRVGDRYIILDDNLTYLVFTTGGRCIKKINMRKLM